MNEQDSAIKNQQFPGSIENTLKLFVFVKVENHISKVLVNSIYSWRIMLLFMHDEIL